MFDIDQWALLKETPLDASTYVIGIGISLDI
jgi:hypothetical protein